MRIKLPALILSLVALGFAAHAQAQCSVADQIAPNPNPFGNTLTLTSATACNSADPYQNLGTLNNQGTLVNEGIIQNGIASSFSSSLNNDGTLINKGSIVGNTGTLRNHGTMVNEGVARSWIFINDGTLINRGVATASFVFSSSGTVANDGRLFATDVLANPGTMINNGSIEVPDGPLSNSGVLINNGTIDKTIGFSNSGVFHNNGSMNVFAFPINNGGIVVNAGQIRTNGKVNNSGQFSILAGGEVSGTGKPYSQTAGTTTVDGVLSLRSIEISGGVLQGSGSTGRTGSTFTSVTVDGGTISPGNSPGTLTINGNYTQSATGTFAAEIGGRNQGIEYDLLKVLGIATLDGTLQVTLLDLGDGLFSPHPGDTFDILSAEQIVGSFSNLLLPELWRGQAQPFIWGITYLTDAFGTTDVVRLSVSPIPEPEIYAMLGVGLGVIGWVGRRKKLRERAAA